MAVPDLELSGGRGGGGGFCLLAMPPFLQSVIFLTEVPGEGAGHRALPLDPSLLR